MRQVLRLNQFPGLNEFIAALKKNRFYGNKFKQLYTEDVAWAAKQQKLLPFTTPIQLEFIWVEANARRDPDNIVFAKKFILDGLQNAGIIPRDSQKYIKKFTDEWAIDVNRAGVFVIIEEWNDDRSNNRTLIERVDTLVSDSTARPSLSINGNSSAPAPRKSTKFQKGS